MIPYGHQWLDEQDIAAVNAVLNSDWLTQGPLVPRFEQAIAERVNARYAVAVNSATSALHLACLALGLGPGDQLWTTANSFVASANCGRYCGADIDFVDINPATWNLCPQALAEKLAAAARTNTLPKVLVVVHFAGLPCDMAAIHQLCSRYSVRIIEDASHALGAVYNSTPIGQNRYSDLTVFSFHPVKIITSGEGGLVTTNDAQLATSIAELRTHGITKDKAELTLSDQGPWYYEQQALGFNYRMMDMAAALGLSQLQRLDIFLAQRRSLVQRYHSLLAPYLDHHFTVQQTAADEGSAWHLFVISLQGDKRETRRRKLFDAMRTAGIGVNVHYLPIYRHPYYQQYGFQTGYCPHAEAYYQGALTLPLHPQLTTAQQDFVISTLVKELCD